MTWYKHLNPTPSFPAYTGPYKVGSIDVEIPTSELVNSSSDAPPADLSTVSFRLFYPCKQESAQNGVKWLPNPQREHLSAYAKFMGAKSAFAEVFALLPQLLYYISIPVHSDAELLHASSKSKRWPLMMFSHGLGGSRNAYSHICGSIASHGVVVVAPEHRDGSASLSTVRTPGQKEKYKHIPYRSVPHTASTDVYKARDEQLRIRLWEMGMIHDALMKIDQGVGLKNLAQEHSRKSVRDMHSMFANTLDVHEPGKITFAGHSFGACTTVQLMKSVYYGAETHTSSYKPLFAPISNSGLARQITSTNPVILLDLWTLPIQSPDTAWLKAKPMPCYDSAVGGSSLLSVLSEAFYKWSANFEETKRVIAKPDSKHPNQPGPNNFYPITSAHLSQSDFGILFPWLTTKIFGAKEPERVLRLNTRAILQVMRDGGINVSNTSAADLEVDGMVMVKNNFPQDDLILSKRKDAVRGWVHLGTGKVGARERSNTDRTVNAGPGEAIMEGEVSGGITQADDR